MLVKKEYFLEEIKLVLRKSRGEPSKLIELIICILELSQEGKIASCKKVIMKLWPDEWQHAKNKVAFEQSKWNLLLRRRSEINERVFQSHLCFNFFIALSQQKQFQILTDLEEIYHKRIAELQKNLVRAASQSKRESIKAQITELTNKFRRLEKGEPDKLPDAGVIISPPVADAKEARLKLWLKKRWKWATAGIVAVLVIAAAITIKNIFFQNYINLKRQK